MLAHPPTVIQIVTIFAQLLQLTISFEIPLFRLWISEFPPIPLSTVDSRSLAIFQGESIKQFLSTLENLSKLNTKLYIEIHSNSEFDFIKFLNTTQVHLQNIVWMPCIVIFSPDEVENSKEAEKIVLTMMAEISNNHFPLTSEVYVAFELRGDVIILCDLFEYKVDISMNKKFCNEFSFDKPLYASEEFFGYNPVSKRRRNLKGATLNVIAQYDPSYVERLSLVEYENGTVEYTRGMCLDILLAMQVSMNFSFVPKKGNGWTGLLPNGSWTGMSAQLINKEADLSVAQASMVMMIDQLHGISFLQASAVGQFVALFKQPSSSVNLLTSVMPGIGWILSSLTWGIVLLSVFTVACVHKKSGGVERKDLVFTHEALLWALTTACQKGYYVKPTSLSFQIICLVASFLGICIYVACSATLTGKLVTEEVPIKNFQDLSKSKLEVYTDKWLPVSRSLIEKIYGQRGVEIPQENSNLYTIDDALPKVIFEKAPMAFVTFVDGVISVFDNMNRTHNFFCDTVSTVKVAAAKSPAGMFVRKGSPLKEILNYNILMLAENGILHRLNAQYDDKTQIKCLPNHNNYRGGLSLKDLQTSFLILLGGFALTLVWLISEKLISTMRAEKNVF